MVAEVAVGILVPPVVVDTVVDELGLPAGLLSRVGFSLTCV